MAIKSAALHNGYAILLHDQCALRARSAHLQADRASSNRLLASERSTSGTQIAPGMTPGEPPEPARAARESALDRQVSANLHALRELHRVAVRRHPSADSLQQEDHDVPFSVPGGWGQVRTVEACRFER